MSQQVTGKLDSDCISRQAAIDGLLRNQEVYSNNFNCFRLFCSYLKEKSTDDAIASMTVIVNLINESVVKGEDDGQEV